MTMISSKSDFAIFKVPLSIKGTYTPPMSQGHTETRKRKQHELKDYEKPTKVAKDKGSPKKQKTDAYDGTKIPVHAVIQGKITSALPDRFQMKKIGSSMRHQGSGPYFP